jgi:cytochrome c
MSDLKFNSAAGAVLASLLGVMVIGLGADAVVQSHYPEGEQAGWRPEVVESASAGGGGAAQPAGPPDFGRLFADEAQLTELVSRGAGLVGACRSCHSFDAGAPNGTGPNLQDVFGRPIASRQGFSYSGSMDGMQGAWDYTHLDEFLRAPSQYVPGTRMNYPGIRSDRDRVAVIAYLRSISPNSVPLPAPLPEPEAASEPEGGEGGAAPAQPNAQPAAPAH